MKKMDYEHICMELEKSKSDDYVYNEYFADLVTFGRKNNIFTQDYCDYYAQRAVAYVTFCILKMKMDFDHAVIKEAPNQLRDSLIMLYESDKEAYKTERAIQNVFFPMDEGKKKQPFFRKLLIPQKNNENCTDTLEIICLVSLYIFTLGYEDDVFDLICRYLKFVSFENEASLYYEILLQFVSLYEFENPKLCIRILDASSDYLEQQNEELRAASYWVYGSLYEKQKELQRALFFFEKTYEIRKRLYGVDHWYTILAKREIHINRFCLEPNIEDMNALCEFVDYLIALPDNGQEDLLLYEGRTLYVILSFAARNYQFDVYEKYMPLYSRICTAIKSMDMLINDKLRLLIEGNYYFQSGKYLQADVAYNESLMAFSIDKNGEIVSDFAIKSNLLLTCLVENDIEQGLELLDGLSEEMEKSNCYTKDMYRVLNIGTGIYTKTMIPMSVSFQRILNAACDNIIENVTTGNNVVQESFIDGYLLLANRTLCIFVEKQSLFDKDVDGYAEVLERAIKEIDFNDIQKQTIEVVLGILYFKNDYTKSEHYLSEAFELIEKSPKVDLLPASICYDYAFFLMYNNEKQKTLDTVKKGLKLLDEVWKNYLLYIDDSRLIAILESVQEFFALFYCISREMDTINTSYEKVLNYKALASLVGKERNVYYKKNEDKKALLSTIREIQNKVATIQVKCQFSNDKKELDDAKYELKREEAKWIQSQSIKHDFTIISLDNVMEKIPNETVSVEYFNCFRLKEIENMPVYESIIEIFVIEKKEGQVTLHKHIIEEGEEVLNCAMEFTQILHAESLNEANISQMSRKEELKDILYESLIYPILKYLNDCDHIYIAPDGELLNIPFELLLDINNEKMAVTVIECARDFIFSSDSTAIDGNMIIGNPEFSIKKEKNGNKSNEENRGKSALNSDEISPLPFSQIEASRVARYFDGNFYTGIQASKYKILNMKKVNNLHIATHGYFDMDNTGETLFSSCLLMAGANEGIKNIPLSKEYGNGILTADEISRMDLHSTELVVLSSCLNGMNDVFFDVGFHGMVSAFGAAGVKYVISCLWAADDCCTAILMERFYYYYKTLKKTPPEALSEAKRYIKNVTVEEIRKDGWFSSFKGVRCTGAQKQTLEYYDSLADNVRPFKQDIFWGGFVCYRCN